MENISKVVRVIRAELVQRILSSNLTESEKVKLTTITQETKVQYKQRATSRCLASAFSGLNKIEVCKHFYKYTDNAQSDILIHEFLHIIANRLHNKNCGHLTDYVKTCIMLGYDRELAKGTCKPELKVEYQNEPKNYKFIVRCSDCGKVLSQLEKANSSVKTPEFYRSKCCNAKIVVDKL